MTDALDKLIEAVEAGTHAEDIHWRVYAAAVGVDLWDKAKSAANGSLDAAHALHKAVLPEWDWDVNNWSGAGVHPPKGVEGDWVFGNADTPARAWLLAILRAMKESEPPA